MVSYLSHLITTTFICLKIVQLDIGKSKKSSMDSIGMDSMRADRFAFVSMRTDYRNPGILNLFFSSNYQNISTDLS